MYCMQSSSSDVRYGSVFTGVDEAWYQRDWQAAAWQIPVKITIHSLLFYALCQLTAFFCQSGNCSSKVYLQGDCGGNTVMVRFCSVPHMSWSSDVLACELVISLFRSGACTVKTPFCRETVISCYRSTPLC